MNDKLRIENIWQNIRFALFQKFSSGSCKEMPAYRKVSLFGLLFALSLCVFTVPSLAQTPSWSRGIQNLSISFDECKNRARRALEAEGYTIENQGGSSNSDYHFGGYKDIHNAVIACNSSSDGKTWVNVFVASCLSNRNGNVPGAERVRLQGRMDDGGQIPNLAGDWESSYQGTWKPTTIRQDGSKLWFTNEFGNTSAGFFENSTRVKASDWQGGLGATIQDVNTIKWDNGTVWRRRIR